MSNIFRAVTAIMADSLGPRTHDSYRFDFSHLREKWFQCLNFQNYAIQIRPRKEPSRISQLLTFFSFSKVPWWHMKQSSNQAIIPSSSVQVGPVTVDTVSAVYQLFTDWRAHLPLFVLWLTKKPCQEQAWPQLNLGSLLSTVPSIHKGVARTYPPWIPGLAHLPYIVSSPSGFQVPTISRI